MTKTCGTGNAFSNRPPLAGPKELPPRLFWAVVGSGLSLRRGSVGWRFDCPRDPAHTVTFAYRKLPMRTDSAVYMCCHPDNAGEDRCTTLQVVTALGCTMRDLYQQPASAADGSCLRCRALGYRVAGVVRGRPVCLQHLLEATQQPLELLFDKAQKR